ncbi:MAG: hypothetical protein LBI56_00565 [Puniceicoccales bacterium]|nr:hypothetical protein [Puniceicoccales bacterium]
MVGLAQGSRSLPAFDFKRLFESRADAPPEAHPDTNKRNAQAIIGRKFFIANGIVPLGGVSSELSTFNFYKF